MYATDQKIIQEYAQQSTANMLDVFYFVVASIQQPTSQLPTIVEDFRRNKSRSRFAFSFKAQSLDYIHANSESLYALWAKEWDNPGYYRDEYIIDILISIPGINLVKAGFLAQLLFGRVGCIDRHNARLYGIDVEKFSVSRMLGAKSRSARIIEYCQVCKDIGGSQYLWDAWCSYVAARFPNTYKDAQDVSTIHVEAIVRK